MESWRKVWRDGIEPLLSTGSLEALRHGLANGISESEVSRDWKMLQQSVTDDESSTRLTAAARSTQNLGRIGARAEPSGRCPANDSSE